MGIPKVPSYGTVTVKALADLPARILGGTGIQVNVTGFDYRIDVDIEELQTSPLGAANGKYTMVWDSLDGTYKKIEFTQLPAPYTAWDVITGKPATFPPTLPIAESDVTNLVTDLASKLDNNAPVDGKTYGRKNGAWQDVAAGVTIVVNWTDIVGKPATFPPSAHTHPESDVTGLVADLAARELIANKGAASGYAPLDSGSKVPSANLPAYLADAPSDGKTYGRNTATWSNITDAYTAKTGANGASNLPIGTTAQRPTVSPGLIRFNTDTATFEGYNGTAWAGIGGGVFVGLTAPANPRNGDLWWKSDAGLMLIYYDDGGSQQWVVANPSQDIAALDTRYAQGSGVAGTFKVSSAASSATILDIALPAGYFGFDLLLKDLGTVANGELCMRLSVDGTTFPAAASSYTYAVNQTGHNAANVATGSVGADRIIMVPTLLNSATVQSAWKIHIPITAITANVQEVIFDGIMHSGTVVSRVTGMGMLNANPAIGSPKAIRLFMNGAGANLTAATSWQLNGIR